MIRQTFPLMVADSLHHQYQQAQLSVMLAIYTASL